MNGAEVAVEVLADSGIRVCFGNPGTTEMDLLGAIAQEPRIRYVPTLHEGVAAGAADGYFRIAGRPAMSLLHNGIGLANALTALYNARRAESASLTVVGDHADELQPHRLSMSSGVLIEDAARSSVPWAGRIGSADAIGSTLQEALYASGRPPRAPSVVALPSNIAWSDAGHQSCELERPSTHADRVSDQTIGSIAVLLRSETNVALLLGNAAARDEVALSTADRIAHATEARLLARPATLQRGARRIPVEQFIYSPVHSAELLKGIDHLVLVGIDQPVVPWGYPGLEQVLLTRKDATVHVLATTAEDVSEALDRLAAALQAPRIDRPAPTPPAPATGPATASAIAQSLAAMLPEGAVFLNEGISNGRVFQDMTADSLPHTMLINVGGAIGWAQSAAIGCAVADPSRKVVAVQGDGAAMYLPQAMWTMARENLDITVVILANSTYKVLELDLALRGITGTQHLTRMGDPVINWVSVANGLGVTAEMVKSANSFNDAFKSAIETPGPRLIVVQLAD